MKRRTLLKGILGAVALRALPAPRVRGALVGEVAPPQGLRIPVWVAADILVAGYCWYLAHK